MQFWFADMVQLAFFILHTLVVFLTMEQQPLNPVSPAGSPTAGGTTIDGAVTRRMLLATEAA